VIATGETRVLCTAMLSTDVPPFLVDRETGQAASGWVTAEYNMLPGCTPERQRRGGNSRATEIKRLIGRSLRAAVDMSRMPGVAITCDCDVLKADGGTRTASITGAYVALADALAKAEASGLIVGSPIVSPVAAVSVGIVDGEPMLDPADLFEVPGAGRDRPAPRQTRRPLLPAGSDGPRPLFDEPAMGGHQLVAQLERLIPGTVSR